MHANVELTDTRTNKKTMSMTYDDWQQGCRVRFSCLVYCPEHFLSKYISSQLTFKNYPYLGHTYRFGLSLSKYLLVIKINLLRLQYIHNLKINCLSNASLLFSMEKIHVFYRLNLGRYFLYFYIELFFYKRRPIQSKYGHEHRALLIIISYQF